MSEEAKPAAQVALATVGGNLYRLVDLALRQRREDDPSLPESPIEFIRTERAKIERRADNLLGHRPFRLIAIDLTNLTGVDVTHESVRRWYREDERARTGSTQTADDGD